MSTNRNKDASPRSENTFTNPIGSLVPGDSTSYRESTSSMRTYTDSERRHTGQYSADNPYFNQMRLTQDKQDIDALYEHAIQWEADYANRQLQLEENRAILEEQRQYDLPVNQVARQRAAGINPDLQGSGSGSSVGSGSQAQLTNPGMADQTGQTKFSNQYDNASLVFEGINTASNVVGTFASGFSSIVGALDTIKTLPSRLALNSASAGLQTAQANEITELLAGKKEGVKLSNVAQGIQNSTSILQQLARFSDLIAPDTPDMSSHLSALGVPEAQIPAYTDMIKQMHANPKMREQYASAELGAKWSEAENAQYTEELVGRMVSSSIQIKENELAFQEDYTKIQASVQSILASDPNYTKNQGELIITDAKQARDQQDFAIKKFERDVLVYAENIEDIKWAIQRTNSKINDIYKKAGKEKRDLNPTEKAIIEDHQNTIRQMRVLGSQQVQQLYGLEKHAMRLKYFEEDRMNPVFGDTSGLETLQKHNIQSRIIFDDIMTDVATPAELAIDVSGKVITALAIYGAGKGMRSTGRTNYKFNKSTGRYEIGSGSISTPDYWPVDVYTPQGYTGQ